MGFWDFLKKKELEEIKRLNNEVDQKIILYPPCRYV